MWHLSSTHSNFQQSTNPKNSWYPLALTSKLPINLPGISWWLRKYQSKTLRRGKATQIKEATAYGSLGADSSKLTSKKIQLYNFDTWQLTNNVWKKSEVMPL